MSHHDAHHAVEDDALEMILHGVERDPPVDDYQPVRLRTNRGTIDCRYYPVTKPGYGSIWVGGVGGGFDTPADGLYPKLCAELRKKSIASLRVRFRDPMALEEAVLDVLAGIAFLESAGVRSVALVGHSFGGAVVIQAAAVAPSVRTVVALATQSYGADAADELAPRCTLLLLHGEADDVLPPSCSDYVFRIAGQPKKLVRYPGAGHVLNEVAGEVHTLVEEWVSTHLKRPGPQHEGEG